MGPQVSARLGREDSASADSPAHAATHKLLAPEKRICKIATSSLRLWLASKPARVRVDAEKELASEHCARGSHS